jgi:hypothetical protein
MLGIRWTIGDVSRRGFESLRLSIWGAWGIFGADADYWVCVNTVSVAHARQLVGPVPDAVTWHDDGLAEGVAWKLAPLRCFPDRPELSLDNDVILWELPTALAAWLVDESPERCLLAEDVVPSLGQFASVCEERALNSGIRGLPAGFDLEQRRRVTEPHVVTLDEVTICSPFPPHLPQTGRYGAHFVGLNARRLGWDFHGEPAERVRARHWDQHRAELYARVGIEPAPSELSTQGE